jgi:hypothetical protein
MWRDDDEALTLASAVHSQARHQRDCDGYRHIHGDRVERQDGHPRHHRGKCLLLDFAGSLILEWLQGVPLPFPTGFPSACDEGFVVRASDVFCAGMSYLNVWQAGCPVSPGQGFNYTVGLPVLTSYPAIARLIVKWEITDQVCVMMMMMIMMMGVLWCVCARGW